VKIDRGLEISGEIEPKSFKKLFEIKALSTVKHTRMQKSKKILEHMHWMRVRLEMKAQ